MKYEIRTSPTFEFQLTQRQLVMLTRASAHHYDATCRSLSEPRREGGSRPQGLLVGWANIQEAGREFPECGPAILTATWREVDLCLKCMEWHLPNRAYDKERVRLTQAFRQMLTAWTQCQAGIGHLKGETK